jgi:signal recognition particle subunit SEC65
MLKRMEDLKYNIEEFKKLSNPRSGWTPKKRIDFESAEMKKPITNLKMMQHCNQRLKHEKKASQ